MARQQGTVLVVVLVVLVLALLAGLGVMREVQTANTAAGNFSFRQIGMAAADQALSQAMADISARVEAGGVGVVETNRYLPVIDAAVDARGMPASVDWDRVPCTDASGAAADCARDDGTYRVQYVVERRCSAAPDIADASDIRARCEYEPHPAAATPTAMALRYRVLVRTRGPRGTETWFEGMVSGPATL